MLTTAKSVTFNPAKQPTIDQDEDASEFTRSHGGHKRTGSTSKRNAVDMSVPPVSAPGSAAGGGSKAKSKGKGRATPLDLGELVHGGDWDRCEDQDSLKHKFEVSPTGPWLLAAHL